MIFLFRAIPDIIAVDVTANPWVGRVLTRLSHLSRWLQPIEALSSTKKIFKASLLNFFWILNNLSCYLLVRWAMPTLLGIK